MLGPVPIPSRSSQIQTETLRIIHVGKTSPDPKMRL